MPQSSPAAARPNLARTLADRPPAIAVLAALHSRGGASTPDELRRTCPSSTGVDAALGWLRTAGLVHPEPPPELWPVKPERLVHILTPQGWTVACSLAALAQGLSARPDGSDD